LGKDHNVSHTNDIYQMEIGTLSAVFSYLKANIPTTVFLDFKYSLSPIEVVAI
jgi:hypothetical protein